jgi:hypothetical protein
VPTDRERSSGRTALARDTPSTIACRAATARAPRQRRAPAHTLPIPCWKVVSG